MWIRDFLIVKTHTSVDGGKFLKVEIKHSPSYADWIRTPREKQEIRSPIIVENSEKATQACQNMYELSRSDEGLLKVFAYYAITDFVGGDGRAKNVYGSTALWHFWRLVNGTLNRFGFVFEKSSETERRKARSKTTAVEKQNQTKVQKGKVQAKVTNPKPKGLKGKETGRKGASTPTSAKGATSPKAKNPAVSNFFNESSDDDAGDDDESFIDLNQAREVSSKRSPTKAESKRPASVAFGSSSRHATPVVKRIKKKK
jgi:hypothetical protein